jgi:hypothetical protein
MVRDQAQRTRRIALRLAVLKALASRQAGLVTFNRLSVALDKACPFNCANGIFQEKQREKQLARAGDFRSSGCEKLASISLISAFRHHFGFS